MFVVVGLLASVVPKVVLAHDPQTVEVPVYQDKEVDVYADYWKEVVKVPVVSTASLSFRIAARRHRSSVEVALRERIAVALIVSWGDRQYPATRYFSLSTPVGQWRYSAPISFPNGAVRIAARKAVNNRVEVALQKRVGTSWGDRQISAASVRAILSPSDRASVSVSAVVSSSALSRSAGSVVSGPVMASVVDRAAVVRWSAGGQVTALSVAAVVVAAMPGSGSVRASETARNGPLSASVVAAPISCGPRIGRPSNGLRSGLGGHHRATPGNSHLTKKQPHPYPPCRSAKHCQASASRSGSKGVLGFTSWLPSALTATLLVN